MADDLSPEVRRTIERLVAEGKNPEKVARAVQKIDQGTGLVSRSGEAERVAERVRGDNETAAAQRTARKKLDGADGTSSSRKRRSFLGRGKSAKPK